MNTAEEIREAMIDYQQTQFGGWPWEGKEMVHPRAVNRYALHADGTVEKK